MSRRKKRLPEGLFDATIEALSHDGRGVARLDGKTTFIDNALAGEQVRFRYTWTRRKFDEGRAEEIVSASPERTTPPCAHAGICGGCSLQHMHPEAQIRRKQAVLEEQLAHFGALTPEQWLPALTGPVTGYRAKARLGVKYVEAKGMTLVGFREKRSGFLALLQRCEVLIPEVGHKLSAIADMIDGLESKRRIPQIEVAAGDDDIALVFRHLDPLPPGDLETVSGFCQAQGWHCYLQPGGDDTVHRIWPQTGEERLTYSHAGDDLTLAFHPMDFTQVNGRINRDMVPLALDMLDIEPHHRVLDLFCGLGNFTLPAARRAARVVGVEGSAAMVRRGYENAARNGLDNVDFHAWDLTSDASAQPWGREQWDRVLIDPPRTGALEIMPLIGELAPQKVVYVSCNPATLARDAGELVKQGYRLVKAGVMDMFPHTTHVESIALFER
ncbi:MAG: 23S rRNA (uracil(1939)-C(5))-methyltransferase RlmD [Alcanivoracaceae bacterium]|nr:23S rRNA (uracil(1939)-C(5))-methyltransferase RlmD [Alcanivoracaceae bacterium]